jgi:cell wall-associated NlpC family hydrolase
MEHLKRNLSLLVIVMFLSQALTFCTKKLSTYPSQKTGINEKENSDGPNRKTETDRLDRIEKESGKRLEDLKKSNGSVTVSNNETLADRVLETAKEYLGVPYCFGGVTTRCLDCSGFVRIVFEEYGIDLPHSSQEQSKKGTIIRNKKDLIKGDLIFFHGSYKTNNYITHSAIYAGDNKFIHASTGKGVTITSLNDPWWKGKFSFGTRILQ